MNSLALQAESLRKVYRQGAISVEVLKGVDLMVRSGELVAVVGPSGAGKTTLLYLLGGLSRADSGHISVGGVGLTGLSDAELSRVRNRRLGFVFQAHNLLPELDATMNVALPLRIGGQSNSVAEKSARQLLQEVGLGHRLGHKPGELSGGEQQRVAVARAMASQPDLILADEPTGNLDRANSEAVFEMLKETTRARGQAVVMVTHNDDLARRADRVVRMRDGLIEA